MGAAELFNRRPQAGTDGEESGWKGNAMATRRVAREPPLLASLVSQWARRSVGAECRACAMGAGGSF
jgi:hypothetical protein